MSTILAKFPSIFFLVFIVFFAAIASANDGSFNLKKCSNTLSDSIIERKALKGDIEAQYFLGKKYFSPSCSSSEQEKGLRFLMKASQGQHSGHFMCSATCSLKLLKMIKSLIMLWNT